MGTIRILVDFNIVLMRVFKVPLMHMIKKRRNNYIKVKFIRT